MASVFSLHWYSYCTVMVLLAFGIEISQVMNSKIKVSYYNSHRVFHSQSIIERRLPTQKTYCKVSLSTNGRVEFGSAV